MTNTFPSVEKLLSLLRGSPEVKVLIEREKVQAVEAEKQARLDCLARIQTLQLLEFEAKQKLDIELSAVTAAEDNIVELRTKVAIASTAYTKAQHERGRADFELSKFHGEWAVSKTLYMLNHLIQKTETEIGYLELAKNQFVVIDGRATFRPVAPEIGSNQQILKQRLVTTKALYEKTKDFVNAEMLPSEIVELCASICGAVGIRLQPVQTPEAAD